MSRPWGYHWSTLYHLCAELVPFVHASLTSLMVSQFLGMLSSGGPVRLPGLPKGTPYLKAIRFYLLPFLSGSICTKSPDLSAL